MDAKGRHAATPSHPAHASADGQVRTGSRWLTPALQSLGLCLLFAAMAWVDVSVYVSLPVALLVLWLPALFASQTPGAVAGTSEDGITRLTRDLSRSTSHNALSAAAVAFSVR